MGESKDDDTLPVIDKLQTVLSGENQRQRLALFFCTALISMFCMGGLIGFNAALTVEKQQPLILHIALFLCSLIFAIISVLVSVRFIQSFKLLLASLDSKEDSQQAGRAAQQKAA